MGDENQNTEKDVHVQNERPDTKDAENTEEARKPNTAEKPEKVKITFDDDSEGSGPEAFEEQYTLEDMVKTDFVDEFDLFRHFFRCLKKTGHILKLISALQKENTKIIDQLFERSPIDEKVHTNFSTVHLASGPNKNLANASKKICLKYTASNGRHLVTNEHVSFGDVLIAEKAVIVTDIANAENVQFKAYRCHHCTKCVSYFITCPTCDVCIFCSYDCRKSSWFEYHRWECYGFQRRFWFTPHPQYMAMRLMFFGAQYKFDDGGDEFQKDFEIDTKTYGHSDNLYKYICKLPCDIRKRKAKNLSLVLMKCAEILVYLIEDTKFFHWLYSFPKYAGTRLYDLYMIVGGFLVRHYIQSEEHVIYSLKPDEYDVYTINMKYDYKSGGMYVLAPLVKIDCDSNIMWTFRNDQVVGKALSDLKPGTILKVAPPNQDFSSCSCDYCKSFKFTMNIYNGLRCHECSGPLLSCADCPFILRPYDRSNLFAPLAEHVRCTDCEQVFDVKAYMKVEANARKNIETYERTGNINHLLRGMNMFESILQSSHSHLCSIYELVINQGLKNDVLLALNYIQSNLAIMELHWGKHSYMLLVKENEYLCKVINVFPYFNYQSEKVAKFSLTLYERTAHLARLHCVDHRLQFNGPALEKMVGVLKNKKVQKKIIKSDVE